MEILQLLNELEALGERGEQHWYCRFPLFGKTVLDAEEYFDLLSQLRASLPQEMTTASQITAEREEIIEEAHRERGHDRVSPWFLPNVLVDSASGQIAIDLGLRGPNYAPVSACATGSHAVGEAAELIRRGDATPRELAKRTDVRVIRQVAESEGHILTRIGGLMWLVSLAALVAAMLAVGATSATTVIERRAEIGLMKAIGASRWLVQALFLAEQVMLAAVGGGLGYLIGIGLARVVGQSVFGIVPEFRLALLPVVLGLAALVTLFGSLAPLRRAAGMSPAPVLRGE